MRSGIRKAKLRRRTQQQLRHFGLVVVEEVYGEPTSQVAVQANVEQCVTRRNASSRRVVDELLSFGLRLSWCFGNCHVGP